MSQLHHTRVLARHRGHRQSFTHLLALAIIALGLILRIAFAWRAGVGYDEVFVIGLGLDEIHESLARWLLEVPVRRSDAVTPLWWWLQAIPALLVGYPTLWGIRCVPVALGGLSLALFWILARRRLGQGPAILALSFVSMSDLVAFSSARGEFAEPLLLLAALPAVCLIGEGRRPWIKGILWLVLLLTHLGKGALIVAGLGIADTVFALCDRTKNAGTASANRFQVRFKSLALSTAVALLPTVIWLLLVDRLLFAAGPVETDTGPRNSIWSAIHAITFGYRTTKLHMLAAPWDSLQVFLDARVWPVATISAFPMIVGIFAAMGHAIAARGQTRRSALVLSLFPWFLLALALVVGRGMIGSRFHLLYLPAAWVIASMGLWRLRNGGPMFLLALATAWTVHLAIGFSWTSWTDRTLQLSWSTIAAGLFPFVLWAIVIVGSSLNQRRLGVGTKLSAAIAIACGLTIASVSCGPLRWGPAARFEPMAERTARTEDSLLAAMDRASTGIGLYPPPHGRSLHIDLANYFLTRSEANEYDFERAATYALLATRYDRNVARAWAYVGLAYQRSNRPVSEIRDAWERSYALNPDPRMAEWLSRLPE